MESFDEAVIRIAILTHSTTKARYARTLRLEHEVREYANKQGMTRKQRNEFWNACIDMWQTLDKTFDTPKDFAKIFEVPK